VIDKVNDAQRKSLWQRFISPSLAWRIGEVGRRKYCGYAVPQAMLLTDASVELWWGMG
jgi:hypothetical protein